MRCRFKYVNSATFSKVLLAIFTYDAGPYQENRVYTTGGEAFT